MAPVISPTTARISIGGAYNTHTWANVMHARYLGSFQADDIATVVAQAWLDNILPALDSNVQVQFANYVDLGTELGVSGPIPDLTLPVSGGSSGPGQSPQVSYLLHLNAPGTRKQRSGRQYLTGVPRDAVTESGSVAESFFDGLQSRSDDFLEACSEGDVGYLAILSKTTGGGHEGRTVTAITVDGLAATQRRRLRR